MKKLLMGCLVFLLVLSCKDKKQEKYLPDSVGAINTLAIVIDNNMWKGRVGDSIRKYYAAAVDGLPWEEPLFSIHQMPPEVFTDFARNSRNILLVQKDSSKVAGIKDDLYAKPQKVGIVKAPTEDELIAEVAKTAPEIIASFKKNDIRESQERFTRSLNRETALKEELGVSLTMPSIYKIAKQENNFFWIERQIRKGTMNILVYEMPLNSIPNDSTRVDAIIKMRDSIGQKYVPGREEGMYMITEKAYAPYVFSAKIAGRNAIETKGMWEVKNFMMAGPFINYIVEDKPNNRLLVIEGFTFAPSTNKRDYMFELEAILKTLKFDDKDKGELAKAEK
ncbi:DUF4837 family protein [Galbibacter pacificus]|uniref:DUF4837 family protein n=1 Tax=Galbibacter pacificus TaxID=2996052 RepID=A0ABT6FUA5_9FLAO|nr:DUF4837 family protein [Galbibacter pacificus]MDG3583350.1 DUF4837 family protein [Galbibacter pacificus]MDG3586831.1 DUF4837 family protein [Galbibacter pacificus]